MTVPNLCRAIEIPTTPLVCEVPVSEAAPAPWSEVSSLPWSIAQPGREISPERESFRTSRLWRPQAATTTRPQPAREPSHDSWLHHLGETATLVGTLLLGGALFLLPMGCSGRSRREPEPEAEEEIPNFTPPLEENRETQVAGEARTGTVLWLGQQHALPEGLEGLMPQDPLQRMRYIEGTQRNQFAVLQTLEHEGIAHVFMEGFSVEEIPEAVRDARGPNGEPLRDLFRQIPGSFEELNLEQRLALFNYGADQIYLMRHHNVQLHGVAVPNHRQENMAHMRILIARHQGGEDITADLEAFDESRETYAVAQLMDFFQSRPGETVALVYGADHDFADNFASVESPPRLIAYTWEPRRP